FQLTIQSGGNSQLAFKSPTGVSTAYIGTSGAMGDVPADTLRLRGDAGIAFGVAGVTRLYFDPTGNIGVAKQNPSEKLDVLGNMKVSGTATGAQLVATASTGTAPLVVNSATQVPNLNAS